MKKVNLEVIRKELYSNLSEMFFGAFYHISDKFDNYFGEMIEIKRRKPFSNYEYSIQITVQENAIYCFREYSDFQWCIYYSDCKNKTVLYMKVVQQLTMQLLN